MPVTTEQFRGTLRHWASGVSIVTTRRDGGIQAITVSSFSSVSLDPPLILVCIDHKARSHATLAKERVFGVNILRDDQHELSDLAAGRKGERGAWLEGVAHTRAATGAPILEDCLAWLDCALVAQHEAGDHTICIGRVEAAGSSEGEPLLYHVSTYRRLRSRTRGGRKTR
ncbi:MAG TPA: flavin reductase family protein [Candidatus Polarisedimenticolia bacterium]